MNVPVAESSLAGRKPAAAGIVDCDVHPIFKKKSDIKRYLSKRWQEHYDTFGSREKKPFVNGDFFPKMTPHFSRRDASPPDGWPPGSDLAFMRKQFLDARAVACGLLHPLIPNGTNERNQEYGAALCRALNDWQVDQWTSQESRLRGAIVVTNEYPEAAVAEIDRCAKQGDFVQVSPSHRGVEPLGRRRYWPIFAAAAERGLPIGLHGGGSNGLAPISGGGWSSFQIESHQGAWVSSAALVTSLIMEGVFEEFPTLKVVLVEGGFTWVPALGWRLDRAWERLRAEVPHVKRRPSEYIREHFWYTTQPMDDFENLDHLRQTLDWIGWDRILFSSDYPHWDFDDPRYAIRLQLNEAQHAQIFGENARRVYDLG